MSLFQFMWNVHKIICKTLIYPWGDNGFSDFNFTGFDSAQPAQTHSLVGVKGELPYKSTTTPNLSELFCAHSYNLHSRDLHLDSIN